MRLLLSLLALFTSAGAWSLELKPFAGANISVEQWQEYRSQVVSECGEPSEIAVEQRLEIFRCAEAGAHLAFTQLGHPAYPAWIARKPVQANGNIHIQTIGYFAGDEKPFAELFKQYLALNEQMKREFDAKGKNQ